jgi:hypothetical protein
MLLRSAVLSIAVLAAPFASGASAQTAGGTVVLFDGANLDSWRMDKPNGWKVRDGAMELDQGGYIWTKEKFGNFILEAEFRIPKDCNSGIFFRTGDTKDPVQTGMEMQVIDQPAQAKPVKNDCGALYDLVAPSALVMKPVGEWNKVRITCRNSLVTIEMNGKKIVSADLDRWTTPHRNPDGTENKFNAALKDFPREGYIGFQDHGSPLWYRNVKVTKL